METVSSAPETRKTVTVAAIREALAAAQSGRLADATATAERALTNGGDAVALNALLGMLRGRAGDLEGAIRHLQLAHERAPSDVQIATNLASALTNRGEFAAAFAVARSDLAVSDPSLELMRLRAYSAQMSGNAEAAVAAYEAILEAVPDNWEVLNNLGNTRVMAGDLSGGIAALRRSAEINPNVAAIRLNLARSLRQHDQLDEAERVLRRMAEDFPNHVKPLTDLHDLLKDAGRDDEEILAVLTEAARRAPGDLAVWLALGRQHGAMHNHDASDLAFRKALGIDPANAEAYLGLAALSDHQGTETLDALTAEVEGTGIEENALNLIRALAHRRAKRDQLGLELLARIPEDFEPLRRAELLGSFHDRLGQYDEAFAAFTRMNELHVEDSTRPLKRAAVIREELRMRIAETTPEWAARWTSPGPTPDRPSPIFLLGFPRSGTTLLDTMLMGHPDLEVMEERPLVNDVSRSLGGLDAIAKLGLGDVQAAQQRYFREAANYASLAAETTLVDKSPLHLNAVQYIHRLFPDAHYILALRHPADAVLSCFINNFQLNPSMANFLRLDTAAEFYDLCFSNWEATRALFPLNVHVIRYEDLIENTEEELHRLTHELGLRWHDRMLDHQETAATRGVITTASYAQVTEPIYRRSVDRWLNYRKQLEPILPVLQRWIDKFDYTV